jgi:hypothetical protein
MEILVIEQSLNFGLPKPWNGGNFQRERIGAINFIVGPNGSGKSRFAAVLRQALPHCRLLGTDRISAMKPTNGLPTGDTFAGGYQKSWFNQFRAFGANFGSGIDTFILLEERPDIRVKVEATLSSLFNRRISLEWDSGNLVPKVSAGSSGVSYRADREECHGILELLVLLTHLYNDENRYLIIDEPELNLHPQYQSFFMQEVRSVAGDPSAGGHKKGVFLVTHSPFIIDLKGMEDLASIFSFSANHVMPISVGGFDGKQGARLSSLIPRLNVHHKQLFFSDSPIFVEGILDAQIVAAIQERRKVSIAGAGSCIIDAGGCEEVNKYVELCRSLNKSAFFLYDLDSLFLGTLRQCIRADGEIANFLADLGLGNDFGQYCGQLDRLLGEAIDSLKAATELPPELGGLLAYVRSMEVDGQLLNKNLARARVAMLIELSSKREAVTAVIGGGLAANIGGRLNMVLGALKSKNILVLPGGALEHYLPSYVGDRYSLNDSAKRKAVEEEVARLVAGEIDAVLQSRYGALFDAIALLPAKEPVDTDAVLFAYLSDYVHQLQGLVLTQPSWEKDQINLHFASASNGFGKLFETAQFCRESPEKFSATIKILGIDGRTTKVNHETNAGMRRFELEAGSPPVEVSGGEVAMPQSVS